MLVPTRRHLPPFFPSFPIPLLEFCLRLGQDGLACIIHEFDFNYSRAEADDAKRLKSFEPDCQKSCNLAPLGGGEARLPAIVQSCPQEVN